MMLNLVSIPIPPEIAATPGKAHGMWKDGNLLVSRAQEEADGEVRWHMAISHRARYPKWDEIKEAAREVLPHECFYVMCFPPDKLWLSFHRNCFHLWETKDVWLVQQMITDGAFAHGFQPRPLILAP